MIAPTTTRSPTLYPWTASPSSWITPTGSCPTIRPGATGYSARQMCESVPQIVVVVTRTIASVGPQTGTGTSSIWMSCGPANTAARIIVVMAASFLLCGASPGRRTAGLGAIRRRRPECRWTPRFGVALHRGAACTDHSRPAGRSPRARIDTRSQRIGAVGGARCRCADPSLAPRPMPAELSRAPAGSVRGAPARRRGGVRRARDVGDRRGVGSRAGGIDDEAAVSEPVRRESPPRVASSRRVRVTLTISRAQRGHALGPADRVVGSGRGQDPAASQGLVTPSWRAGRMQAGESGRTPP